MLRCSNLAGKAERMNLAAILVAGGRGVRAGPGNPKQFRHLGALPTLAWSLRAFAGANITQVVIAACPEHQELTQNAITAAYQPPFDRAQRDIQLAEAGATRTASVRAGLKALAKSPPGAVLIHDAARPGLSVAVIERLRAALEAGAQAIAPALAVTDSLRRQDADGADQGSVDRTGMLRVQTPQAFPFSAINAAYEALPADADISDDLTVAAAAGMKVRTVAGDPLLMKLTYEEDFAMFERLAGVTGFPATGSGFDAHRFADGDHVTLCGLRIDHDSGLAGHSDADVAWHALVDAILGALGEGDIGAHFPPSDAQWKGAASSAFVRFAVERMRARGARLEHVDITIICERPKISPHREAMRASTAEILGLDLARVSVKATTTEQMGFTGRREGIAAMASATLTRRN